MSVEERVPNERLRHARSLKGWSQAKLAEEVGTSYEMVSRWERGITVPTLYFRAHLCAALGMTAEELGLVHAPSDLLGIPTSPFVFLACSYADSDKAVVTRIKTVLQKRGIPLWSSRHIGRQGLEQPRKALGEVVRAAQVILLIVSPEARSSRHVREALEVGRMYRRPVYAVWIEGEDWQECLPQDEQELSVRIDARTSDDPNLFEEIATLLQQGWPDHGTTTAPVPGASQEPGPTSEPRNPYKGLQPFRQEDHRDFFGRDALIDKLTSTLAGTLQTERSGKPSARLLAIIGPSGSGKSSVMMAGLLPRLQHGAVPGSQEWIYLGPIVPGAHPVESLALALAEQFPDRSLLMLRQDLEEDSARGLHQLATAFTQHQGTRVLLCVDQFEELFAQTSAQEERQQFLELLVTALTEPRGPVIVVLTLRADFYDRVLSSPVLVPLIEQHQCVVPPMNIQELRMVIEQPARLPDVHLTFEGDLVGDLLFEMQGQAEALPLLQFTLDQLFQQRRGSQLTLEAYQAIGGVKGALIRQAESTYTSLPSEEHRKLARALFLRLIDPGVTEQDTTRRRITRSELVLSDSKETVIMEEVTRAFTAARLLTTDTVAGVATVEVSHEAVIREWARLSGWLNEAREDVHRQQTISEDAAEWERYGKPKDRLYRGTQLSDAKAWSGRSTLSANEAGFLRTSSVRQMRARVSVAAICLLVVLLVIPAGVLFRQVFFPPNATIVTTLADNGQGSLRQAIDAAKPGGIVTFDAQLRGVIRLTSNINIGKDLIIRGPGAANLSIMGDGKFNVVLVEPWASVTISDLAFNGTHQTQRGYGIIINYGSVTLSNSIISGNTTFFGSGGITNYGGFNVEGHGGRLTVIHCRISGNEADNDFGGGIENFNGTVTVSNSRIFNNSALLGGGIFNYGGSLTLSNSMLSDNTANGTAHGPGSSAGHGGGILNVNGGKLTLNNSAIIHNIASGGWGGGIDNDFTNDSLNQEFQFNPGGPLILINTTISGNLAELGGGIFIGGSQTNITFSTIYDNTAAYEGAGILIVKNGSDRQSHVIMRNTLVAGNRANNAGSDIAGTLTSDGYNLIQNVTGATFLPNKQHLTDVSVNPDIDMSIDPTPRENGGPTKTYALLPGSPAIDQIPLEACHINGISIDQRGVKRPDGNEKTCDIGAFESST